jgi:hypothetical protein
MNLEPVYELLLRLYPPEYRALFAREMLAVFQEAAEERRGSAFLALILAEWIGLAIGAAAEWIAKFTSTSYMKVSADPAQSALPDEVREAQRRIEFHINRMVYAISHHQFEKARFYSNEERKARESLRLLREKYNIEK